MNIHVSAEELREDNTFANVRCLAPDCQFRTYPIPASAFGEDEQRNYANRQFRDHAAQYDEGRVPDIFPETVIEATCSVCDWPKGNVIFDGDGGLECTDCKSYWGTDGTYGHTNEY